MVELVDMAALTWSSVAHWPSLNGHSVNKIGTILPLLLPWPKSSPAAHPFGPQDVTRPAKRHGPSRVSWVFPETSSPGRNPGG